MKRNFNKAVAKCGSAVKLDSLPQKKIKLILLTLWVTQNSLNAPQFLIFFYLLK